MTPVAAIMVTRCPKCATAFRVSASQLQSAKGLVRCGSCLQVFHAQDHEVDIPIAGMARFDEDTKTSQKYTHNTHMASADAAPQTSLPPNARPSESASVNHDTSSELDSP